MILDVISTIIPLPELEQENDIVLKIYGKDGLDCGNFIRPIPVVPFFVNSKFEKWNRYRSLKRDGKVKVLNNSISLLPLPLLPTSNTLVTVLYSYFFYLWCLAFKGFIDKNFSDNPDAVITQSIFPDAIIGYCKSKRSRVPLVLTLRGRFREWMIYIPLYRKILKSAKIIIVHNGRLYSILKKSGLPVQLIVHPLEEFWYPKISKSKSDLVRLITVARLLPLKNIDHVLLALTEIKLKTNNFIYHIVGTGSELDSLKELVKKLGLTEKVQFHGYQEEKGVQKLLLNSDIFVMPSFPETLGRSFQEAAASGCLVIGHKDTGIDGVLRHNESGIFVDLVNLSRELGVVMSTWPNEHFNKIISNSRALSNGWRKARILDKYRIILTALPND